MEEINQELHERVYPIFKLCLGNKGDLATYDYWKGDADASKKLFYTYYYGLFTRILCLLEFSSELPVDFFNDCNQLLEKYNWTNIKDDDIEKFKSAERGYCEVPFALEYIERIDKDIMGRQKYGKGHDAVCFNQGGNRWFYSDVRGSV